VRDTLQPDGQKTLAAMIRPKKAKAAIRALS
jgi:hypothetical protein